MAEVFRAYNFAAPTTAAPTLVTTGTAVKTMLQIAPPSTLPGCTITEWGVMVDAGSTVIRCELIETDVAATVTAHVAAGVVKMNRPNDGASQVTLGTAATGYTASAEGTTTASRLMDFRTIINAGNDGWHQWPLGREPVVNASKFLRVRVTATVAVNMACYVEWEE
jgi:hypothetical protein